MNDYIFKNRVKNFDMTNYGFIFALAKNSSLAQLVRAPDC